MRIVFFCSGGAQSLAALQTLLDAHTLELAVLPQRRGESSWKRVLGRLLGREGATEALLRRRRIPVLRLPRRASALQFARLASCRPDVACIAGYPFLLPAALLERLACPVINVHASLLPRHRGALPLFWIFHADDRETGATVHLVDAGMDTGAILAQSGFELPRGTTASALADRLRSCGAQLLAQVLSEWPQVLRDARAQDETRATLAPGVRPGHRAVDFGAWGCERVWHFLHGVFPYFREPLRDEAGRNVRYDGVLGYECTASTGAPGMVERRGDRWILHCKDGHVLLGSAS
jgi:methionyl-tRNA formyltransferase